MSAGSFGFLPSGGAEAERALLPSMSRDPKVRAPSSMSLVPSSSNLSDSSTFVARSEDTKAALSVDTPLMRTV